MIIYAIKNKEDKFFNRVHKDFRELSQNTAFYKTEKNAKDELSHAQGCQLHKEFDKLEKQNKIKCSNYYKDRREHCESNWEENYCRVVKVVIKEVEDYT